MRCIMIGVVFKYYYFHPQCLPRERVEILIYCRTDIKGKENDRKRALHDLANNGNRVIVESLIYLISVLLNSILGRSKPILS